MRRRCAYVLPQPRLACVDRRCRVVQRALSSCKSARVTATKLIPSLGVSDIERSLGFYRTFFGFEVADSYDDDGRMAWCWLRARGAELMLQQLSADQQIRLNPAIGQSWVVYVRVDDIEAAAHQARARRISGLGDHGDRRTVRASSSCPTRTATSCGSRYRRRPTSDDDEDDADDD